MSRAVRGSRGSPRQATAAALLESGSHGSLAFGDDGQLQVGKAEHLVGRLVSVTKIDQDTPAPSLAAAAIEQLGHGLSSRSPNLPPILTRPEFPSGLVNPTRVQCARGRLSC